LGIAYQIYDDLADFFGHERKIGKTLGTDLVSGKLTLPLLTLLERLPEDLRVQLLAEIKGEKSPQLAYWLKHMEELDVFGVVVAAIGAELKIGEDALGPWTQLAPTELLLQLGDVLRAQVEGLRRTSPVVG
jgi:octaprenyl-diphosphate synthase